jgi:hypothetical protein
MTKIKLFFEGERGRTILTISVVILVGLASFELGRLSKHPSTGVNVQNKEYQATELAPEATASVIKAQSTQSNIVTTSSPKPQNEGYFASKRGKKYYPSDCSAGKTIKMENRIYFATEADAIARGFLRSTSCR